MLEKMLFTLTPAAPTAPIATSAINATSSVLLEQVLALFLAHERLEVVQKHRHEILPRGNGHRRLAMRVCGSAALLVSRARRLPRHAGLYRNGYATGGSGVAAESCNPLLDR